jgi:hypothetical protein
MRKHPLHVTNTTLRTLGKYPARDETGWIKHVDISRVYNVSKAIKHDPFDGLSVYRFYSTHLWSDRGWLMIVLPNLEGE